VTFKGHLRAGDTIDSEQCGPHRLDAALSPHT
jgi:hypothetical protein